MTRRESPPADPAARGRPRRDAAAELRVFGLNACRAVAERRRGDVRKVWLLDARIPVFKDLLAWCARERIGYRVVAADDLERLTQTTHHEGVCLEVRRRAPQPLAEFLRARGRDERPALLLWLDGVGNPHNFGAVLRIAAHFGVEAVLLPPGSTLALNGAACRVAEGGAEAVPLVATGDVPAALGALQRAGFTTLATVAHDGGDLYASPLPRRAVLVFGAEGGGVSPALARAVGRLLRIPGTGAVESLNVATAVGVIAAEHWRQHRRRG